VACHWALPAYWVGWSPADPPRQQQRFGCDGDPTFTLAGASAGTTATSGPAASSTWKLLRLQAQRPWIHDSAGRVPRNSDADGTEEQGPGRQDLSIGLRIPNHFGPQGFGRILPTQSRGLGSVQLFLLLFLLSLFGTQVRASCG
jgi:hypothetical protein